jgi:basic membrane lipoprotein Med (substrate-binding protein (PBP1-ABC) superfamily)
VIFYPLGEDWSAPWLECDSRYQYNGPTINKSKKADELLPARAEKKGKPMKNSWNILAIAALMVSASLSCTPEEDNYTMAVFVPGALAGSPTYELMAQGVQETAGISEDYSAEIIEGGFDQSSWESQVTALAASGKYDLIITSNPAMPEICDRINQRFPEQQFLALDGTWSGNPKIATFLYNNRELSYLHGVLAALISKERNPGSPVKSALIAGQDYPQMNQSIFPGFVQGVQAIDPQGEVLFRIVGNWYDASKATELANNLFDNGVEVILPIAGSAGQGVISAAKERGKGVLWYESNGYGIEPGVILGSGLINADQAARELSEAFASGQIPAEINLQGGVAEGYVQFITDDPVFQSLGEEIRSNFLQIYEQMLQGELSLPMPTGL